MKKPRKISISDAVRTGRISSLGSSKAVIDAIHGIEKLIGEGRFAPGDRLIEAELIRELGSSRGPIREALRILAGDGIVELIPHKGARIRAVNRAELVEMVQVVVGLFRIAAELFDSRHQPERAKDALRAMAAEIRHAAKTNNKHALAVNLTEYHQVVIHFSGNTYLARLLQRVHIPHYIQACESAMDTRMLRTIAQDYDKMTEAFVNGDSNQVKEILTAQLAEVVAQLQSNRSPLLEQALDPLMRAASTKRDRTAI